MPANSLPLHLDSLRQEKDPSTMQACSAKAEAGGGAPPGSSDPRWPLKDEGKIQRLVGTHLSGNGEVGHARDTVEIL